MQTGFGNYLKRKKELEQSMKDSLENSDKLEDEKLLEEVIDSLRNEVVNAETNKEKTDGEKKGQGIVEAVSYRQEAIQDISVMFLEEMELVDDGNPMYDRLLEFNLASKTPNTDGTVTIKFKDGTEMSMKEFQQEQEKLTIDRDSQSSITALVDNVIKVASDEGGDFDYAKQQNKINQIINNPEASLYSLSSHKLINGNSFRDHMIDALSKGTYEDLGISPNEAKELDPTPNTPITSDDASKITQTLISNEDDMLKDYLVKYYTDVLQLQYNVNLPKAEKPIQSKNNTTASNKIKIDTTEFA